MRFIYKLTLLFVTLPFLIQLYYSAVYIEIQIHLPTVEMRIV